MLIIQKDAYVCKENIPAIFNEEKIYKNKIRYKRTISEFNVDIDSHIRSTPLLTRDYTFKIIEE